MNIIINLTCLIFIYLGIRFNIYLLSYIGFGWIIGEIISIACGF